ncbi:endonuclease/exonuclease/phosphatase family protein [Flaviramulus sp. BrNp1-15]|uniref:endonuclease/exonuclease/phosphatase family protein n=1 Tax=Flaviramulus sp. BrNp1-15 TaxID=2916754 RepID=UPI001EE8A0C7|nr:endonuclease/exonuclease/phosphatase family protein [Flaviramulus sp. BrNp1-15]ULC59609.1 endonuclease/exonuclease/phosphatase family protein [Flaviramulus sp. BrNp1-15]
MLKIVITVYRLINFVIIITLLALHFFIKDRTYDTSIWFYLFPLPIIILIIVALSIFLGKKRKYNLIIAAILLSVWLFRSFRISFPKDIKETDVEVVFWNASRDNDFDIAITENNNSMPDVLVLTETTNVDFQNLQLKHPNIYLYKSKRELEIFSKAPIQILSEETSTYKTTVIHFKTADIEFYAVDVSGSFDVPRAWELKYVNSIIKKKNNTIILGDFNVPYESLLLKEIKKNYNHFFSKKGNGFRETWFWNLPILSLDHIWVSKDLEVINSKKINSKNSDHSMIKTVIRK